MATNAVGSPLNRPFSLFEHFMSKLLQEYRCVVDPLDADTGALAADRPVVGIAVYMAVKIGVRHTAADIKGLMGKHEESLQDDREIVALFKAQFSPFLRRQVEVMISHHKKFVSLKL